MKKKVYIVFLLILILVLVSCQNNETTPLESSKPANSSVGKVESKHSTENKEAKPSSQDESSTAGISPTPDERSDPELEREDESNAQQSSSQAVQSSFSSGSAKNGSENKRRHDTVIRKVTSLLVPLRDIPAILAHAGTCIPMIEFQHWDIHMANGKW